MLTLAHSIALALHGVGSPSPIFAFRGFFVEGPPLKLTVAAQYITNGDIIIGDIYLIDGELFVPNKVQFGTATLFAGPQVVSSFDFDRRMGNSDGAIKLALNHPTPFSDLQLKVDVTAVDGSTYSVTVPVTFAPETPIDEEPPLLEQPPTVNPGWLDQQRLDENLETT